MKAHRLNCLSVLAFHFSVFFFSCLFVCFVVSLLFLPLAGGWYNKSMSLNPTRDPAIPTVTFLGAAQTVAGSMHLVEAGGERILLDCGSARLDKRRSRADVDFPFRPDSLDAVVLSHAHVDHCGNLPSLVRQGYEGPIYCTPATRDLIGLMLGDSARIQDEDEHVLRVLNHEPEDTPPMLSARSWVEQTLHQCVPVSYEQPVPITPQAHLRLIDAGHILGSAMVSLTLPGPGREVSLTFTGDTGRRGLPFLHDTAAIPPADVLICESTYGGRRHQTVERMAAMMAAVVERSASEGGVVLIPAFSLGRTQLVVHYLCRWMADGLLPQLPLFVDSPLAADISQVYARYPDAYPRPPLGSERDGTVIYVRSPGESDELEERRGPCIIVASGGMCDGGRIVKHLRRHIDDPRASLVLVSYQAPDSLGRKLLEKGPKARFHGRVWNKWIDVKELNGFSGHADHDDHLAYLAPLVDRVGKVRLVHGEPQASWALAEALARAGFDDVDVPAREDTVRIG